MLVLHHKPKRVPAHERKVQLSVQKSGIHGYGVFTNEPLKKGQFIAELRGSRVTHENHIHGQSNRYPDWIGVGKNTWIDPIDEFQYLNHSCDPNAGLKGDKILKMYAMRDIAQGEEITIDYSTTEDDLNYCIENNEQPHEYYREYISSIQTLPVEVFKRYLPYIPDHFQKVYKREVLSKKR